jgi:hypothetical protein
MAYIGQGLTEGQRRLYSYTASAGQTAFAAEYTKTFLDVYQNGVLLSPNDYVATNGTSVILNVAASLNDEIIIISHNTFSYGNTVSASSGGTFAADITVDGTLTVGNHILPDQNLTHDLGSSSARFRDLYLSGSSIDLGGAVITSDGSGVTLPAGSTISGVTLANASSIDELTDVDISTVAPTNGQILVWDSANSKFVLGSPSTPDLSATNTDSLSEGTTNLYYTDARAQTAAQAVSINDVVEDTTPQLGGHLESNGNNIKIDENSRLQFTNGGSSVIDFIYQPSVDRLMISGAASGKAIDIYGGSDVELYSVGNLKLGWLGSQAGIYISANAYSTPVYINSLEYPKNDGTSGQVLTTDGAGTLSWTTASGGASTDTLADVTARGATTNDAVTINNTLTVTSIDSTGLGFATLESASDISLNAVGDINANSSKITNLATPTVSTDAATKGYVDGATGIVFILSSSGSTDYVFSGDAFPVADADPVLYLYRGLTYIFDNTLNGTTHPFEIRVSNGGVAYSAGITGSTTGVQTFTVPMFAPSTLYYQCTVHSGMGNTINIV